MKLRAVAWAVVAVPLLALLVAVATPSCNSSSGGNVPLGGGCTLNSDCKDPLHCIFQLCHQQCKTQEDCTTPGSVCFIQNGNGVCVTQQEDSCTTPGSSSSCQLVSGTTCVDTGGGNDKCLLPCTKSSDCTQGQACLPASGVQVCQPVPDGGGSSSGGSDGGSSSGGDGGGSSGGDASHDAGPSVEAGVLGYVPSNFGTVTITDGGVPEAGEGGVSIVGPDGGIDWSSAPAVSVTGSCINDACLPPPLVVKQSDGSLAHLFVMKSLTVQTSALLQPNDTAPVIFAVLGDVDVQGTINLGANLSNGGPGAPTWGGTTSPQGPGGGANGWTPNYPASGGGGGSFCGVGGKGGAATGAQAVAGSTYPGPTLVPLVAGSAGGWVNGYAWGAGGGALQISSGTSILVRTVGIINAGGGGGGTAPAAPAGPSCSKRPASRSRATSRRTVAAAARTRTPARSLAATASPTGSRHRAPRRAAATCSAAMDRRARRSTAATA